MSSRKMDFNESYLRVMKLVLADFDELSDSDRERLFILSMFLVKKFNFSFEETLKRWCEVFQEVED